MAVGRRERQTASERESKGTKRSGQGAVVSDQKNGQGAGVSAEETKPRRRLRGNGVNRLMKAADRAVAENSAKLAGLLLEDALKGKVACARLLVALSERMDETKKKKLEAKDRSKMRHGGLTAADLLGSEENWESETDDAMEGDDSGQ